MKGLTSMVKGLTYALLECNNCDIRAISAINLDNISFTPFDLLITKINKSNGVKEQR
jgi:hypothetical protein